MMRPPLVYRLFSLLLAPVLIAHACRRALRDGGRTYLRERFGYIQRQPGTPPVWLHCASVGEVVTALPLLRALQDNGTTPLVISVNTPTGYRTARQRGGDDVRVVYLPLDRPRPVRRFLDRLRPRTALILETELWPWLYAGLDRRGIPIALVNARLSTRTLHAPAWWRGVAAWCLGRATLVLARSRGDADAFARLGAPPERTHIVGDLKLAATDRPPEPITLPRPFVLAASTHDDEERRLAGAWREHGPADHLLVIVPRHPERGAAIARDLAADGHRVTRRSLGEAVTPDTTVHLADTLGELTALMASAELVIMGGSMIPHGGQNVLEPARAGRAVVTGKHMENFRDATEALQAAGALCQCEDVEAVARTAAGLLADPSGRDEMGRRGQAVLEAGAELPRRYADALATVLDSAR